MPGYAHARARLLQWILLFLFAFCHFQFENASATMVEQPSRRLPFVRESNSTWIYREYLKEKLRVRERYWRQASDICFEGIDAATWIIPDGQTIRKFLPLLVHLVKENLSKLVLLESAVDLMDYRNTSPSLSLPDGTVIPESSALQERSKIQKLLHNYPQSVFALCDLSIREEEYDEWDIMGYSDMSIAERSSHALVRAGIMFRQQLVHKNEKRLRILILSSDSDFVQKFPSEEGIEMVSVDDFISTLIRHDLIDKEEADNLHSLKDRSEEEYRLRNAPPTGKTEETSNEHLSEAQVEDGLKTGELVKAKLSVTKENPKEAFVIVGDKKTYFVNQLLGNFNRAFHQDVVILKPLPESQWGFPVGKRRLMHHRDDEDEVPEVDADQKVAVKTMPSARVVAIVNRSRRRFVATMVDAPLNDESSCLVIPMDIRIPRIRLRTNGWRKFVNKRLLIEVDGWVIGSAYPHGRCIDILGAIADLETEISCLLTENEVHLDPFSAAALACLPSELAEWRIPKGTKLGNLFLSIYNYLYSVTYPFLPRQKNCKVDEICERLIGSLASTRPVVRTLTTQ
jgi:hypothetical protein